MRETRPTLCQECISFFTSPIIKVSDHEQLKPLFSMSHGTVPNDWNDHFMSEHMTQSQSSLAKFMRKLHESHGVHAKPMACTNCAIMSEEIMCSDLTCNADPQWKILPLVKFHPDGRFSLALACCRTASLSGTLVVDRFLPFRNTLCIKLNGAATASHGWMNTASNDTEVAQRLKAWISEPIHSAINGRVPRLTGDLPVVPTRLIKIVLGQRPTATLVNVDEADSKLRWGVLVVPFVHSANVPLRLTTQSEPSWRAGIALGTLPAWLQTHMINLSRWGVSYMWADVFCLYQDRGPVNPDELAHHTNIAAVLARSAVTIVEMQAADTRPLLISKEPTVLSPTWTDDNGSMRSPGSYRLVNARQFTRYVLRQPVLWSGRVATSLLLSNRIVYALPDQLWWRRADDDLRLAHNASCNRAKFAVGYSDAPRALTVPNIKRLMKDGPRDRFTWTRMAQDFLRLTWESMEERDQFVGILCSAYLSMTQPPNTPEMLSSSWGIWSRWVFADLLWVTYSSRRRRGYFHQSLTGEQPGGKPNGSKDTGSKDTSRRIRLTASRYPSDAPRKPPTWSWASMQPMMRSWMGLLLDWPLERGLTADMPVLEGENPDDSESFWVARLRHPIGGDDDRVIMQETHLDLDRDYDLPAPCPCLIMDSPLLPGQLRLGTTGGFNLWLQETDDPESESMVRANADIWIDTVPQFPGPWTVDVHLAVIRVEAHPLRDSDGGIIQRQLHCLILVHPVSEKEKSSLGKFMRYGRADIRGGRLANSFARNDRSSWITPEISKSLQDELSEGIRRGTNVPGQYVYGLE
ncbi:hypothetical protein ACRE_045740 [Hapsidospora chrysogenum ATCC 11550]|uniref:Heterokaryon incompatibility domain-containing protein n=1 Tax=Hapsidospora chrysogenum (strain ATCC 11550 / CBS 779.69 / DSM 880 / IAM 14645 / JCM 23072 / IMI 49137) TaxID=857340 RepID=A0A086T5J9_HAPC1|nr:hypothetical protein ACRE_045740 [Hapsidospora chrysogenum ATCC 11550]